MTTLWFSYSNALALDMSPPPLNSPYTITHYVGNFLRQKARDCGWGFEYRNLDDTAPADIGADDIVIGHTWFDGGFMDIALASKARAKFILQPYSHGMVSAGDVPRVVTMFDQGDHLFLITGRYWWDTMDKSPYADLQKKATRLDMAVDASLHPLTKTRFNERGKRTFCVMGTTIPAKGMDIAAEIARVSGIKLGYYGRVDSDPFDQVPRIKRHSGVYFTPEETAKVGREYDFFLSTGRMDANPTTLLETASWGLIGACTKESGYWPDEPFYELRTDDLVFNLEQIERLQWMSDYELRQRQQMMRRYIEQCHSWDRFCATIWEGMKQCL